MHGTHDADFFHQQILCQNRICAASRDVIRLSNEIIGSHQSFMTSLLTVSTVSSLTAVEYYYYYLKMHMITDTLSSTKRCRGNLQTTVNIGGSTEAVGMDQCQ